MASRIAEKLAAKKAAIYIRVSTHWQVDKDSLKVQRRELIAYVTLVLGITDYVVFEDPGGERTASAPPNTPVAAGGAKGPPAPTSTSPIPRSARSS